MSSPMPRAGALAAALAIALALFAAMAGTASAKVTWTGIGPAKLGMSEADVKAKLGQPSKVGPIQGPPGSVGYRYRARKLVVVVYGGQVVAIHTWSRAQRTRSGVGVGTSTSEMRSRLKGEMCYSALGRLVCSVDGGTALLDFVARHGKVRKVSLIRL